MRFNHNSIYNFRFLFVLLLSVMTAGAINAQITPGKKIINVSVTANVIDDNGVPIPKAKITVGEGVTHLVTDENGTCSFLAYSSDFVTVSAVGYEKSVSLVQDIPKSGKIALIKAKLFMTSDDEIPLPYTTTKRRFSTGSNYVIKGEDLERYPSNDLRNALTGLVPGLIVQELNGATGISAEEKLGNYGSTEKIAVNSRGNSMMYIIDEMPVDITEIALDPHEIESVTIMNDIVSKAMFGPMAANGVVYIKTKRGKENERILSVNVEDGVSTIDRFPGWTSGADYATLHNLAKTNDGITTGIYDRSSIDQYGKNDPYNMFYPSVNYRDLMLKNTKAFRRANISSKGGSENVQYFSYLGYDGEGDIFNMGSISDYSRINARSNIDIKINDVVKIDFNISASLSDRRSPNYGYSTSEGAGTMNLMEITSALPDINRTPPIAFPIYAKNDATIPAPWYAVSSSYPINPVGNLERNGYYTENGKKAGSQLGLTYDFFNLIKGLKSRTLISFDGLSLIRKGKPMEYIAYTVIPNTVANTTSLVKVHDGVDNSNLYNLHDYYYTRVAFSENLSYEKTFARHNLKASMSYFLYRMTRNGLTEPMREQLGVFSGKYTYNDKFSLDMVLNYAGTYSFAKNNRAELFPSIGASWVISEENFMSNLKFINFLKLRAEAGILGADNFFPAHTNESSFSGGTGLAFGPYNVGQWFGSTTTTTDVTYMNLIGNDNLGWEKRKEFSAGFDALMMKSKLYLSFNYYNNLHDNIITRLYNMPYTSGYTSALPYFNYTKIRYYGVEAALNYTGNAGKLGYSLGANATLPQSKVERYAEPQYRFDYQYKVGHPADAFWGQTCIGKFATDAEAMVIPQLYDAVLKTGDLKYKDMNNNGVIDDNDNSVVGHTTPKLYYSFTGNLKYQNFELTVVGTGAAIYDIPMTNSYFWNGWGDDNYSNFVKDNIGGSYPRLTYYKVSNNFINSDYWLTKGGYFKIQNVELSYTVPGNKLKFVRSQGLKFYVRGANLLTISKVKVVDPESINSGVTTYPLYRTFSGGIKLTF
jgi:TonB-linked SusC/RagA family outer membrane protein